MQANEEQTPGITPSWVWPVLVFGAVVMLAWAWFIVGFLAEPSAVGRSRVILVTSSAYSIGSALLATNIDPITMLFWSAVINGVVAVPIMVATMLVVSNKRIARQVPLPRWLMVLGWLAAALMALAVVLMIWSSF